MRAVTSLEKRLTAVLYVRQLLIWLAFWCIALGVAGLIARFAFGVSAWWLIASLPIVVAGAALHARRMRPSRDALLALLDAEANCGGLLMASASVPMGAWSVEDVRVPRVHWTGRRHVVMAALAAVFAAAVLLTPLHARQTKQTLDVRRDADQLQKRVDLLREEQVIPDARAQAMTAAIETLRREADAEDPAKAWETLDSMAEATAQAAREAGEDALRRGEQLTRAEAMAMALSDSALEPSKVAEGMKDLAKESENLLSDLPASLREAIAKDSLTQEQLEHLAAAAGMKKGQLRSTLNKLRQAGLLDPKTLRQFDDAANAGDRKDLARFLRQNANRGSFSTQIGQWCQGGKPGRDRGRGDAPMFFGEDAEENGKFREQTLPAAAAATLNESRVVAVSAAEPEGNDSQRSAGGALTSVQAGSGSAITPVVLPRHRATVERFFERKKQ